MWFQCCVAHESHFTSEDGQNGEEKSLSVGVEIQCFLFELWWEQTKQNINIMTHSCFDCSGKEEEEEKRSRESRVLCDVVPTHRTPAAGDWITLHLRPDISLTPDSHHSGSARGGVERRSVSPSLNLNPPTRRMLILSSLQTFSLSLWVTVHVIFFLPVFYINNNKKKSKKRKKKRPLFDFIRQSQGCWPRVALEN